MKMKIKEKSIFLVNILNLYCHFQICDRSYYDKLVVKTTAKNENYRSQQQKTVKKHNIELKLRTRGKTTREAFEGYDWIAQHTLSRASMEGTSKHMRMSHYIMACSGTRLQKITLLVTTKPYHL